MKKGQRLLSPAFKDLLMPFLSIVIILGPILIMRPRVMSYYGLNLLLNMAVPISLATIAQMFAMTVGEIDFSMGNLVSLVTCVVGMLIPRNPFLGYLMLLVILLVYMGIGALIYLRKLPSIIITIGMSFVWTGMAITLRANLDTVIPSSLERVMNFSTPLVPLPIIYLVLIAALAHFVIFKTNFGILVRGVGGNQKAISQSGHSTLKIQIAVFGLVGFFGILSGFALAGVTTSATPYLASNYTLIAVASVILGGGTFAGGIVSPIGAVMGACTMTLVGTLLTFLKVSPDWQIGTQGMIILAVIFLNNIMKKEGKVSYV